MSQIIIRVPKNKEAIYAATNIANIAAQAGITAGVTFAKQGLYSKVLQSSPIILETDESKLRTPLSQYDNNLILKNSNGTQIEFIDAIINVTQKNTIKSTELINRSGRVKEFIQKDDYDVTITGNLLGDRDKFPLDALKTLIAILYEPESYEVASVYLDTFGINKVALNKANFEQKSIKYMNVMPFTLTFTSDEDYNFLMEEE